jgi:hypothetical protein
VVCRNATAVLTSPSALDTYWASFEEISKYNVSLNYFERLWLAWYTYMQNDVLATGIMSFVMHEAVYFGRSLPWIIIDAIPWFNRYKIQQVRSPRRRAVVASGLLTAAEQNSYLVRAMAMCGAGVVFTFHR